MLRKREQNSSRVLENLSEGRPQRKKTGVSLHEKNETSEFGSEGVAYPLSTEEHGPSAPPNFAEQSRMTACEKDVQTSNTLMAAPQSEAKKKQSMTKSHPSYAPFKRSNGP